MIDSFDLPVVQGTLKSLLHHHNSKTSILQHAAFFLVQLSLPYMTRGKAIAFITGPMLIKVMSLLFTMLYRFVIAFLPRSKRLNFVASVTTCSDFGAHENEMYHCFHFPPSICHELMRLDAVILLF